MMNVMVHIIDGCMCQKLVVDEINLCKTSQSFLQQLSPFIYEYGSTPILGILNTPDMEITGIKWLPNSESPGEHRVCVFEFTMLSLMGKNEDKMGYPQCCWLNTWIYGFAE